MPTGPARPPQGPGPVNQPQRVGPGRPPPGPAPAGFGSFSGMPPGLDEGSTVPVGSNVAVADRPGGPRPQGGARTPNSRPGGRPPGARPKKAGQQPGAGGLKGWFAKDRWTWRRIRRLILITLGVLILGPFVAFAVGWMIFKVPTANEAATAQVATFTFADGETPVATLRPENVNRTIVPLDQIPPHVRFAVLGAEDRSFYSNPGFDIVGIGRAVFNQLTGGGGGGSTITQQYVKVSTGEDAYSLWRKYQEAVLAVKITREQSKDEILENYLNTVYLGRGASGVQAASEAYFGKPVSELNVSEGAMLASIIQTPSRSDPADPAEVDRVKARWEYTLDGMVEGGWLSPAERAAQVFPTNFSPEAPKNSGVPSDDRYHIYERALAELSAMGITEEQINTEGLTITTTIDQARQVAAVDSIKQALDGQPENLRGALVSIDPRTGAILAYYGGANGLALDYAGEAERQAGSTFKPFVLSAALQNGIDDPEGKPVGLGSVYNGQSGQEFVGGVTVNNSEGVNCEQCTVQFAMTKSINTVFYRMGLDVGAQKVIDAAHQAGIPNDLLTEVRGGISLGDQEVHPIDMAAAFGTFAADGVRRQPYLVSRVTTADGRMLFDRGQPEGEQVMDGQVARNVTESLLGVAESSKIQLDGGRQVAVKTGTVQRDRSGNGENKDAWTVGYTPSVSTAVWIGTDASDAIKTAGGQNIFGRLVPGKIWQTYMNAALDGTDEEEFSPFEPIGTAPGAEPQDNGGQQGGQQPGQDQNGQNGQNGQNQDGQQQDDGQNGQGQNNNGGNGQNGGPGNGDGNDDQNGDENQGPDNPQDFLGNFPGFNSPNGPGGAGGGQGNADNAANAGPGQQDDGG